MCTVIIFNLINIGFIIYNTVGVFIDEELLTCNPMIVNEFRPGKVPRIQMEARFGQVPRCYYYLYHRGYDYLLPPQCIHVAWVCGAGA